MKFSIVCFTKRGSIHISDSFAGEHELLAIGKFLYLDKLSINDIAYLYICRLYEDGKLGPNMYHMYADGEVKKEKTLESFFKNK